MIHKVPRRKGLLRKEYPVAVKRIITLSITLALFLIYVGLGNVYLYGYIDTYPRFARAMLVVTMIYVVGGCILQTAGFKRAGLTLGTVTFILLCVFLFYSTRWHDYIIFIMCMYLVLRRSAHLCGEDCANGDCDSSKQ